MSVLRKLMVVKSSIVICYSINKLTYLPIQKLCKAMLRTPQQKKINSGISCGLRSQRDHFIVNNGMQSKG